MKQVADKSVHLIVTSPPYPMIEMWDDIMARQNPKIKTALINGAGNLAFELMHQELDKTWAEVNRVLIPGGFACINIGDATRTINGDFALYSNHSRIINAFLKLGFSNMPNIMWRKQTNAPNKFMGSGMLPAGAYVTLEHEWILIFRKGGKRAFKSEEEKLKRKESSFFWEERNVWFSDLWDLKGIKQNINTPETRARSAAYPFEIPHRLINMYSLRNDTVLDPFLGTGTTTLAAVTNQRNSIGYEIDPGLSNNIENNIMHTSVVELNSYVTGRIEQHKHFLSERSRDSKKTGPKHFNENLNLPVMTSQETEISFSFVQNIKRINNSEIISVHSIKPPHDQRTNPRKKIKSKQINRAFVQAL
ncbi:MAG TPA: site-specific DNA-methyltransferase [Chitinophagaceae bacterium]|nr:site-specific DNA-methyltransferase [Chitinophagaceae bacterium]